MIHEIKIRHNLTAYYNDTEDEVLIQKLNNFINMGLGDFLDMCNWTKEKINEVMKDGKEI